ncbi:MAG: GNAT family N-acetyltransferase [Ruminococcus sp.]|nr:GNAT family N-acetyltransferase [Ruminococcus sp.]
MVFISKYFDELTITELYEILRARAEIFVVEQKCPYQDLDGVDDRFLHVFYEENGKVIAYLRAYVKEQDVVQMGRVLTIEHGKGLGGKLLKDGIEQIRQIFHPKQIYIEAQCYAAGYYEREGFKICSEEFLEDGIPHVQMILDIDDNV